MQRYTAAERRYLAIKDEVKGRAAALDEAVSQSAQVCHNRLFNKIQTQITVFKVIWPYLLN